MSFQKNILFFLLGSFLCVAVPAIPWGYSFLHTPDKQVWIPFHDDLHICGDSKIYAAGVQQVRETPLRFRGPATQETGHYWFNIFTEGSRITSAALGLFLPDARLAFVVSFLLALFLNFALLYAMGRLCGLTDLLATSAAVATIFWFNAIRPGGSLFDLLKIYTDPSFIFDFDSISDYFRYVILNSSALFAWLTCLFCLTFKEWNTRTILTFACLCTLLVYSYLGIALGGLALLFFALLPSCLRSRQQMLRALLACAATLVLLLLVGFKGHLDHWLHVPSPLMAQAHLSAQTLDFGSHLPRALRYGLRLLLTLSVPLFFLRHSMAARRLIVPVLALTALIAVGLTIPAYFAVFSRLFVRGISSYWVAACFIALFLLLQEAVVLLKQKYNSLEKLARMGLFAFVAVLFLLPLAFSLKLSGAFAKYGVLYLPADDWEAFSYINAHLPPQSQVLALDLTANQLLPLYTHADLAVPEVTFSGIPAEQTLENYINGWKLVGADTNLLNQWFQEKLPGTQYPCIIADPDPDQIRKNAEPSYTLHSVIYDSSLKNLYGIPIKAEADEKRMNPVFLNKISELIKSPQTEEKRARLGDYVLLTSNFPGLEGTALSRDIAGYNVIFKNATRTLYQRKLR